MSGVQQVLEVDVRGVLGGHHHGVEPHRPVSPSYSMVTWVLPSGRRYGHDALLADLGEPLGEPVRQRDRQRHQLGGVVAGVAEHQALVAGALPVERVAACPRRAPRRRRRRPGRCRATARRSRPTTPQEAPSKPFLRRVVADARGCARARSPGCRRRPTVVTSPATCTWPVVISVSTATRLRGSSVSSASRIESLIWSAILSGWPSVTDSEVNRRRATVLLLRLGRIERVHGRRPSSRRSGRARPSPAESSAGVSRVGARGPRRRRRARLRAQREPRRDRRRRHRRMTAALSGVPNASPSPTSLTTSRSQPLRASLARPWSSTVAPGSSPVSAAKPTSDLSGGRPRRAATSSASTSAVADRAPRVRAPVRVGLLDLGGATVAGRKSATAAAMTTASARRRPPRTASRSSAAVSTATTVDPGRGRRARRWPRPATTSAPRAAAAAASA